MGYNSETHLNVKSRKSHLWTQLIVGQLFQTFAQSTACHAVCNILKG